jgi:hypothetical protein
VILDSKSAREVQIPLPADRVKHKICANENFLQMANRAAVRRINANTGAVADLLLFGKE